LSVEIVRVSTRSVDLRRAHKLVSCGESVCSTIITKKRDFCFPKKERPPTKVLHHERRLTSLIARIVEASVDMSR
jgi:hypothetical protein